MVRPGSLEYHACAFGDRVTVPVASPESPGTGTNQTPLIWPLEAAG